MPHASNRHGCRRLQIQCSPTYTAAAASGRRTPTRSHCPKIRPSNQSGAAAEPALPSEAAQLIDAVKALHPDEMSPREALEAIYALKAKLPKT